MTRLDDLFDEEDGIALKSGETGETLGFAMPGVYCCQTCNTEVDMATYIIEKRLLVYTCDKGHRSKAKL